MADTFALTVNGGLHSVETPPDRSLLDVLREDFGLTGTKYGCGEGQCRACTVLMDGKPVTSCLTPVAKAEGKTIVTIEGLAEGEALHPVQEAFVAEGAMQCGYCTPGMVLTTVALLDTNPHPTREEIIAWMNGNLCRCNGYPRILAAIQRVAKRNAQTVAP